MFCRKNQQVKLEEWNQWSQDFCHKIRSKKPSKHLQLGMAINSFTVSRKVVDILNRLGHSACYITIKELETELKFEATKEKRLTSND